MCSRSAQSARASEGSTSALSEHLRYPPCSNCKERLGIVQVHLRGGKQAPYCAECVKPFLRDRRLMGLGLPKAKG